MKLVSLKIDNYRAINGSENVIEFKDNNIVFLFGKNDIGKSSVLHAYRYFTSPSQKALMTDFFEQDITKNIVIEACFLKEESDNKNFEAKGLNKWVDTEGLVKFKKTWSEVDGSAKKQTFNVEDEDYDDGGFGGLDQILTNAMPFIIYIEAMPSVKSLTDWLEKEIKSKLLKKLKENHGEEYGSALAAVKSLQEKVENAEFLGEISQKANRYFTETFPDLQLNIRSTPYKEADLSKSFEKDFSVTIGDRTEEDCLAEVIEVAEELVGEVAEETSSDRKFDLHGHGLIRQAIINILSLFKDAKDGKKHIILFEEPEIYLHPSNKRKFRNTLYQIAEQDDYQIICVSHDPQIIDMSREHTSLARFVKKENGETVIYQAGDNVFAKDDETRDRVLMLNRFNPHICETFFSDDVILVEGDTEAIVLRGLISDHYPDSDLFVLNTGTKNNIPFFIEVLSHFRINQHVIHDSDHRYQYNKDGEKQLKNDGDPKSNSAWTLNQTIWDRIKAAEDSGVKIRRYVLIRNFEHSHDYEHKASVGKPWSAYEYAKNLDMEAEGKKIVTFLKQVAGDKPYDIDFTQEYLDENVAEPH